MTSGVSRTMGLLDPGVGLAAEMEVIYVVLPT